MSHLKITKTAACLVAFVITCIFSLSLKGQMRQLYVENTEAAEISKFSFYSSSEGYVGFRDWVGYTVDSGRTFTKKFITPSNVNFNGYAPVNLTFGFQINGVKAFNVNEVIAYGSYGLVPAILYSINGGNNFTLVFHSQYNPQQLRTGVTDMIFPANGNIGYAVDADRILKSTNKGVSWTVIRTVPGSYYSHLEAVNAFTVYALTTSPGTSTLQYTSDGGNSWGYIHPVSILPNSYITYAYFLTSGIGWVSLETSEYGKYYIYKTTNAGSSWTLQNNIDATGFETYKFKFVNENTGFALSGLNQVFITKNSGALWEPLARDNQFSYLFYTHNDLQCFSANQVWAGGGQGLIELNTNASNSSIPQAYFNIDTSAAGVAVNLVNFSLAGYSYQWKLNGNPVSSSYNTTYQHDIYATEDTIQLIVSNGVYSDTTEKIHSFDAVPYPPPSISSFTPQSGTAGTSVVITGDYFAGVQSVSFGGIPAASFTVQSLTSLTAVVGAGANGAVAVTTPRGTATLAGFSNYPPPLINSFFPQSGLVGSIVTLNGNNFSATPAGNIVYIGGIRATVTAASNNQLSAIVPAGTSPIPISVTVNGHTGNSTIPFAITFPASCNLTDLSFSKTENFDITHSTQAFASADFNNDGKT